MHTQQNSCLHFLHVMWLERVRDHLLNAHEFNSLATSIFLYGALAFGTFFCIGLDPVGRFTVILTLLQPQLGNAT